MCACVCVADASAGPFAEGTVGCKLKHRDDPVVSSEMFGKLRERSEMALIRIQISSWVECKQSSP